MPHDLSCRFPDERSDSFKQPSNSGGRFEEYHGDHSFDRKPQRYQGEYDYRPAQTGALGSEPPPDALSTPVILALAAPQLFALFRNHPGAI